MDVMAMDAKTLDAPVRRQEFGVCTQCVLRVRLRGAGTDVVARCECGRELVPYQLPADIETPPAGVPARYQRYWLEGREQGFWAEHRLVRVPASKQDRIDERAARRVYAAGHRVGARLRMAMGFRWARRLAITSNALAVRDTPRTRAA
jgi:hypothetical protein